MLRNYREAFNTFPASFFLGSFPHEEHASLNWILISLNEVKKKLLKFENVKWELKTTQNRYIDWLFFLYF